MSNDYTRYDTKQAAPFLGFSPTTLKISRVTGNLAGVQAPAYKKVGRKVFYDRKDLQDWLDQFEPQHNTAESIQTNITSDQPSFEGCDAAKRTPEERP